MICTNSKTKLVNPIQNNSLFVLPLLLFLFYLSWAAQLPVCKAPDEIIRIKVPFFIAQNGYLPSGWEESIRHYIWGISYAFTTYGASLISMLFIKIAMLFTNDTCVLVFAARIPSCLFGSLTIASLLKVSQLLNFNKYSQIILGTSLGLLPQFAFLSSYHNADIFSVFCASLVLLFWVKSIKEGWSLKICVCLGMSLGLLALSYYFAYSLIPLSLVFFLITAKWQKLPWKTIIRYALVTFSVAFVIAGWFFIRNFIIYDGDFLGMQAYNQCAEMYALETFKPSDHMTPKMAGQSLTNLLFSKQWLWMSFKSCVSYLGFMEFVLPSWVYIFCAILVCVSILTSFKVSVLNRLSSETKTQSLENKEMVLLWFLLASMIICTVLFSAYRSWSTDFEPQGRYLICAWVPVFLALETLFQIITEKILKSKTSKVMLVGIFISLSLALLLMALHSAYPACFNGIMFDFDWEPYNVMRD